MKELIILEGNFILSQVKRCNRNLIITCVLLLSLTVLLLFASQRYLINVVKGPLIMTADEVVNIKDPDDLDRYYITVTGTEIYDTGLQYVTETVDKYTKEVKETEVDSDYVMLSINDKFLIAKVPHGKNSLTLTGQLVHMPDDVRRELLSGAMEEGLTESDFNDLVLPLMLEDNDFSTLGYFVLVVCALILLFSLWKLFSSIMRGSNPHGHPIYKKLQAFGELTDIESKIDKEITDPSIYQASNFFITETWLLIKKLYSLNVINLKDIVWIYPKVVKHSTYFIPTGKTHSLVIHLKDGTTMEQKAKNEEIGQNVLQQINDRVPHVVVGYTDELIKAWNRNRTEFINSVLNADSQLESKT